jgi:D-alanine-D-alanine ligase-like ATP-grasp enzyme
MKKRIGVLRGGKKEYYENSLREGGKLISHLHENLSENWKPIDILIDKENIWHVDGIPIRPADLIHKVDVVWNTACPSYSLILKNLAIPNLGTNPFTSLFLENRKILEEQMKNVGAKMPRHFVIPVYQKDFDGPRDRYIIKKAKEVHEKFSPPWIIKSLTNDSQTGIHVANSFPELVSAIEDIVEHARSILVEEFIAGKVASVHSVSDFRAKNFDLKNIYNFPPIEIKKDKIISPGKFSSLEKEKLEEISRKIFEHLNISYYLNLDFILHPKRGIFLKNISFFPDLKKDSHFHHSCESVGAKAHQVIEHILNKIL